MKSSDILAVVVSYNGHDTLLSTIESLIDQVSHILIVDNNSSSNTFNLLSRLELNPAISVIYLNDNFGIGFALNIGIDFARTRKYSWVLTMDQDSILDKDFISSYKNYLLNNQFVRCLSPNIRYKNSNLPISGTVGRRDSNLIDMVITSGNLVNISVFEKIGLYNEPFFIDCVDFDFSLKLKVAQIEIHRVSEALLYHQLGDCQKKYGLLGPFYTKHSALRRYYMYRNILYISKSYIKVYPILILKTLLIHILYLISILVYEKRPKEDLKYIYYGIRDYYKNIDGKFIKKT